MHPNCDAQTDTTVVIDINGDYINQLKQVFKKTTIVYLTLIIPENQDGYDSYKISNFKTNYENPHIFYDYKIETLPNGIENMESLQKLDISGLGLSNLPEKLFKLKNLKFLDISRNEIDLEQELPKIKALKKLETLKVYGCRISSNALSSLQEMKLNDGYYYSLEEAKKELKNKQLIRPNRRNNILFKLLNDIYKYYPIGTYKNESYPGYSDVNAIVISKLDRLNTNEIFEPWDSLVLEFQNSQNPNNVINLAHNQFPNYELMILISDNTQNNIRIRKNMHLTISLLTNHYTIYFDSYLFLNEYLKNEKPIHKRIIFGKENSSPDEKEIFLKAKSLVQQYFNSYEFIEHDLLFETPISGGIPYKEDIEFPKPTYSLFSFLFGMDTDISKEIVK